MATYMNNFCHTELCLHMLDLHMLFYTAVWDWKGSQLVSPKINLPVILQV